MKRVTVARFAVTALAVLAVPRGLAAQSAAPAARPGVTAKAAAPKKAAKPGPLSFAGMDRNADQRLTEEEFRNAMAFVFAGQDANHDDVVTRAEVERHGPAAVQTFDAFDTARTGRLEWDAFMEFTLGVFHSADTDGDGVVTVAERDALRAKYKK
jgi:hypothetical protein